MKIMLRCKMKVMDIEDFLSSYSDKYFDYIFTGPPDFDEIGLDPRRKLDRKHYYEDLYNKWFGLMRSKSHIVTIAITDRKHSGIIDSKHIEIIKDFLTGGWILKSNKIWVKTYKVDLYHITYSHIMTFISKKKEIVIKQKGDYLKDVFYSERKKYKGFSYGINPDVIIPFIEATTYKNDLVCDPFLGSGSTAIAANEIGRHFIGCDIDPKVIKLAKKRREERGFFK